MKRNLRHVHPALIALTLLIGLSLNGIAQEHDDSGDATRTGERHAVEAGAAEETAASSTPADTHEHGEEAAGEEAAGEDAAAASETEPAGPPGVLDFLMTPKFLVFGLLMLAGFVLLRM
ncbi:MAG: hypothetical protein PVF43_04475, partial [Candidatus Eiseniibacteriota bacterium]